MLNDLLKIKVADNGYLVQAGEEYQDNSEHTLAYTKKEVLDLVNAYCIEHERLLVIERAQVALKLRIANKTEKNDANISK